MSPQMRASVSAVRRSAYGAAAPADPPRWALLLAAVGGGLILLPVGAMLLRLPWGQLPQLLVTESALEALRLSLWTATAATALCLVLGVPLGLVLARARFRGLSLLRSAVLLPLVLPPVVGGIALLHTFGRQGMLSGVLEVFGLQVAYSSAAVVLAQTFVSMPFLVISVESAARSVDPQVVEAATVDGAGRTAVLRYVLLPLMLPSLAAGTVLSFARSLGEFGATIAFAGSLQGVTRTLPLEIYLRRETDAEAAVALSLILIVVALVVISAAYSRTEHRS